MITRKERAATVNTRQHAEAAELLLSAYSTCEPIEPLVEKFPQFTIEDSYEVQLLQVKRWQDESRQIKGHKVGLSSAPMQRQMGVDQPDFGHLLDGMFHLEQLAVPINEFMQPRVEPEVAFVLKAPLAGPGITVAEAAAAVDFVLPAVEIIDSRIRDWKISIVDTIADNASSGGVVLGSRPVGLSSIDLRLAGCVLLHNGEVVGTGAGGAVLGSPLNSLVWLANTLGKWGVRLDAGHVILPGSVTAAIPVAAGDEVTARFGGVGSVTVCFAQDTGERV